YRILRFFESQAPIILGRSRLLQLINVPVPIFDDEIERLLESKTTVFSFRVNALSGTQLDQATLTGWIRWMNRDISSLAPEETPPNIREAVSNRGLPLVLGYSTNPWRFRVLLAGETPEDVVRFWGG
ncbi:MAG TPA: hypothetical protein VGL03_03150, partial [Thermoanaerobaculia bacterium]